MHYGAGTMKRICLTCQGALLLALLLISLQGCMQKLVDSGQLSNDSGLLSNDSGLQPDVKSRKHTDLTLKLPETILAQVQAETNATPISCRFMDKRGFPWMLKQTDLSESPRWRTAFPLNGQPAVILPEREPLGLVLPHHDAAIPLIGRVLSDAASRCNGNMPETIILLGPNHKREGISRIQTSVLDWSTPEGTMSAASDWASELIDKYGTPGDPSLFEREYSLSTLVPWLKHYFPTATLLPVLIHGNLDTDHCRALSEILTDFAGRRKTLMIASIDFSHGLSSQDALSRDERTWFLIQSGDAAGILRLGNEYLDAPPTLGTLVMAMSRQTNAPAQLVGHAEASSFLGHPIEETTSYLSVVWPAEADPNPLPSPPCGVSRLPR